MDLTGAAAAGWLATLDVLEREATRPDGITRFRLAAAYLENLIIDGLLLAQPHNYRDALALGFLDRVQVAVLGGAAESAA